jgi:nitroimidazol reductase NimA-like FMN-containing flavoprotein (pyridoxamine 5'-phosphate oxidase superfamily)
MFDSSGLEILDREECLALLATVPVGRIVFTHHALPAVQPVNFVLDGEAVIIRTAAGSKLTGAVHDAVVAFEVDEINADEHSGWSVTAVGHASVIRDEEERRRLEALPLRPWAPGKKNHFLRIPIDVVTGRRLLDGGRPSAEQQQFSREARARHVLPRAAGAAGE